MEAPITLDQILGSSIPLPPAGQDATGQDRDSENGDGAGGGGEGGICVVCSDEASGKHYGVMACNGCKGFFRRSVRAPKPYECRANGSCPIDRMARNGCRACRFKRCLDVGMDTDAIRPDRDKTGKRSSSQGLPQPPSSGALSDVLAAVQRFTKEENFLGEVPPFKRAREEAPAVAPLQIAGGAGDNSVLVTLKQCDDQVLSMLDVAPPPSLAETAFSLADAVAHPTLISPRSRLAVSADGGLATCLDISLNSRRLFTQLIDFINSLRPVADFDASDKAEIAKSVAPPFILYNIVQYSLNQQSPAHCLSLPLGQTVSRDGPLLENNEDNKSIVNAEMRLGEMKTAIMDQLIKYAREMNLSNLEQSAVRALIVLEANYALPETRNALLGAARASILDGLQSYLGVSYTPQEANVRFGNILLLIGKVQQHSAMVISFLQFCKDHRMPVDPIIDRFLLQTYF